LPFADDLMLAYKEYDNAQAVEIVLTGRVSTEEFDKVSRSSRPSSSGTARSACSK
jgi:hypothetical protein